MGESQHPDPGSGMNNPDHIFLELRNHFFAFFGVKILKFFDEDPGSGMETVRIRDGKKSDPGSGINIPDPPHCISHTTIFGFYFSVCISIYITGRVIKIDMELRRPLR